MVTNPQRAPIARVAVAVDHASAAPVRIAYAASLADAFDADLVGLAAASPVIPVYAPFGETFLALQPEIVNAALKQVDDSLARAEIAFRKAAGERRLAWRSSSACLPGIFLAREARAADVLVLGRQGDGDPVDNLLGVSPGELVLQAGRPVIVVPPGVAAFSASRVLIAWKDTREGQRALADALPYLRLSAEVVVVGAGVEASRESLAEIVAFLQAHAIVATAVTESEDGRSSTDALLGAASRIGATLIVAGAYGHSRTREWAFGGVTRSLLARSPVPCFFSH